MVTLSYLIIVPHPFMKMLLLYGKKYPRSSNIFNRALRFFLSVARSTPLDDISWLSPNTNFMKMKTVKMDSISMNEDRF